MRNKTATRQQNGLKTFAPTKPSVAFGLIAAVVFHGIGNAGGLTEVTLRKPAATKNNTDTGNRTSRSSPDRINVTNSVVKSESAPDNTIKSRPLNEPPVLVTVSLKNQQMAVYKGLDRTLHTQISSGKKGHATPTGIFSILEKRKYHRVKSLQ